MTERSVLPTVAPLLFVAIWSTGWIAGRFAALDGDPLTFLAVRFAAAIVVLTPICVVLGAHFPKGPAAIGHALVSGVLLHALYLGGVWWAIAHGVPAGLSAVIAALQPLMTATLAPRLAGEHIGARRMTGFVIGFLGIAIVVSPRLLGLDAATLTTAAVPLCVNVAAMGAVTLGTFHQKARVTSGHLLAVAVLQYVGALVVMLPLAWATETMRFDVNLRSMLTLGWSVIGLSIGAIALLLHLIRCGEVSRAASLIYLVPPAAVVQAWLFFGETLNFLQVFGMVVTAIGVALANRSG